MYRIQFLVNDSDEWSAVPNVRLFSELCRKVPVKERIVATVRKRDSEHKICLGSPQHVETEADYVLWVPSWFYTCIDAETEIAVLFNCSSSLPRPSLLAFTTEQDLPDWLVLRQLLESYFSQLGVLKKGQVFPIPAHNLFLTSTIEEPYVFLDGEEVNIDVSKLVVAPLAIEPAESKEDFNALFSGPMIGGKSLFPGTGRTLGGK